MKLSILSVIFALSIVFANPVDKKEDSSSSEEEVDPNFSKIFTTCCEENSVTEFESFFGDFSKMNEDDQKKMGCLQHCIFQKLGYMKDNKIDVEKVVELHYNKKNSNDKKIIVGETTVGVFEKCANKSNSENIEDNCKLFTNMMHCVEEEHKKTTNVEKS